MVAARVAETKLSVLSSIRATRGASFASTRRENSGGIVSTPLTRPSRRSWSARPGSAYSTVSTVFAPGRDGRGHLADPDRGHAVVLVDDREPQVLDVAAESVAQHDELDDREDERHDDERRAAAEPPQLPLDDRPRALHVSSS